MTPHPFDLTGRVALVTGANTGIGQTLAVALVAAGASIALVGRSAMDETRALLQGPGRVHEIRADLSTNAPLQAVVADTLATLGGLDILVNNAARQSSEQSILDISNEAFDWTLKTNLYAMFWITKAAVPHMPAGASIINTSSVTTYDPPANLLDYSLTKAAITNFSKGLAKQLIDKGIRVNAVAPGPFWTPLQVSGGQTMENLQRFGGDTPMSRPGQPAEIAPLYVLLASTEASYVTGQVFGASGGDGQP